MEAATKSLDIKLIQLKITREKTQSVLQTGISGRIERHVDALKGLVSSADNAKRVVEQFKIQEKEELSKIQEWCEQIEEEISKADTELCRLRQWITDTRDESAAKSRKEELDFQKELYEAKLNYQKELDQKSTMIGMQGSDAMNSNQQGSPGATAKLPKLEITRFDGTYQDWGQFSEIVDKSNMAGVTKFSFLKEFVALKVRKLIDGLPFTAEGYNRAKSILADRYGKECEVIKAYTKDIIDLPHIAGVQARKIHEFYERLLYNVQSLETMGKLQQVNGYVALTMDKLSGIRGDLTRTDDSWEEWDFVKLCDALRLWTRRNPVMETPASGEKNLDSPFRKRDRSNKLYNARQTEERPRLCVYCDEGTHKSGECQKVISIDERKKILATRRLCFNCTGSAHQAAECSSKGSCKVCRARHHTSICDKGKDNKSRDDNPKGVNKTRMMTASTSGEGIFPILTVKVNGIMCRALVDTGAGSSYASAKLISALDKEPDDVETKKIDMLMGSRLTRMEIYNTEIESINGDYKMCVNLIKVNKGELLSVDNPKYSELIGNHAHLKGVKIEDNDSKSQLPVHVVLGGGEYARIKTQNIPHIGEEGEPIAELTKLGWFIMSPGREFDRNHMMLTQTSQIDYEELCRLDVLGLSDTPTNDQGIYEEFKEQLTCDQEGWYETGLPWKGDHPVLPNNKEGSLRRLTSLAKKRKRQELTLSSEYANILNRGA